jgi:uncharacterized glyoxalase superfamily protein PhnB
MPTPPSGSQRIVPYLTYENAPAAISFLCEAFGFEEKFRYPMPDQRIGHAELTRDGNVLMLASQFEGFGQSPLHLSGVHSFVFCYVDDADAHFERARAAGATIVAEPSNEHGQRSYRAMDPEGHRWIFATVLDPGDDASAGATTEGS